MDQAARGSVALNERKYDEAIIEYTKALKINPEAPDYYIKRSTAYQRSTPPQYEAALRDAELGLKAAVNRGRRELIAQAQLRRAIIFFWLGKYGDADFLLDVARSMDQKEKSLPIWEAQIKAKLKELPDDDERRKVTVEKVPDVEFPSPEEVKPETREKTSTMAAKPNVTQSTSSPSGPDPKKPVRHDWYQTPQKAIFSLLVKNAPKDKVSVNIQDHSITISYPLESSSDFEYSLDTFAEIDPSQSTWTVTPNKIEATLVKKQARNWPTFHRVQSAEATNTPKSPQGSTDTSSKQSDESIKKAILAASGDAAPSYPTSSRTGPKNWDRILSNETGGKEEEEEVEGGDEVAGFFKKLYAGADPDTRRAMMKSYQESNGTVLSTNWTDVKKGTVETNPPDGMEPKKWDE